MNQVLVEYDGGLDTVTDEQINKAAGYSFDSNVKCDSGCMMTPPYTRDLAFRYENAEDAVAAAEELKKIDGVRVKTNIPS